MKTCNEQQLSLEQTVRHALMQVIDPEVGENIIDLGLVYGVEIIENVATVLLTMTSAACPMGEMLLDDVHTTLTKLMLGDMGIEINLVWEPPWNPDMMSTEAKLRMGWS
ncbi:MAG: metal-sulfur cluster assembly factor [Methylophilaceae bacterium]